MTARDDLLAIPDELLRSGKIAHAVFVHMDFRDAPKRWWTGFGWIEYDGHRWQGMGDMISISNLDSAFGVSARKVTFGMIPSAENLAFAINAKDRVRNRDVSIYEALYASEPVTIGGKTFSSDADGPVAMFSLFTGTMQRMPWEAEGSATRRLTLECEGRFFRRNAAPRGRWTDADQKARYPGDRGFDRLPLYQNGYQTPWRR